MVLIIDETFILRSHGSDTLQTFFEHLNDQHSDIKFTMEIENKNSLPFQDMFVTLISNGRLGHSVHEPWI